MGQIALPTLNVSPTPEIKDLVEGKVRAGYYASTSEVIRAPLRAWASRDEIEDPGLERLIDEGMQSPARRLTPDEIRQIRKQARRRR